MPWCLKLSYVMPSPFPRFGKPPKPKRAQPCGPDSFTRTLYENEKNYVTNYKVNIVPVFRFVQLLLSMLLFLWCAAAFLLFTFI